VFPTGMVGLVRWRGVVAQEKEPGRGRVRCRVRREWDWGLETGSLLCLGGDQGALKGSRMGILKRIAKSLDGGLGASEDMETLHKRVI